MWNSEKRNENEIRMISKKERNKKKQENNHNLIITQQNTNCNFIKKKIKRKFKILSRIF